jgi:hypothetical protein
MGVREPVRGCCDAMPSAVSLCHCMCILHRSSMWVVRWVSVEEKRRIVREHGVWIFCRMYTGVEDRYRQVFRRTAPLSYR